MREQQEKNERSTRDQQQQQQQQQQQHNTLALDSGVLDTLASVLSEFFCIGSVWPAWWHLSNDEGVCGVRVYGAELSPGWILSHDD
ncbi:hypothetical protein BASA50_010369 [Batrachochytrium salamandrivorans]|uniref:Uncharacterized protein n=1 Tax=Batrachochytrium salamandrivorans TaxID=1357716 RepID=A0ABQ8EYM9_9FUNG|nr:hypothetical protein BASA50_010369 [Batrachochytrium salamandrivorans]